MSGVSANRVSAAARLLVPVTLLALAVYYHAEIASQIGELAHWVATLGPWGPIVFIAGYALAAVAFVPGSVLTVAAGALFGLAAGTAYVFIGASLGACAAFALARSFARGAIERRLAGNARFAAIDRAIAREGLRIVFLLRLSPLFPFSLGNYALGLTRVRFRDYAIACTGMLPWTFVYVYLGSVVGETGGGWRIVVGLLVTAVVVFLIARVARRALTEATAGASE
ncbi:MAG: TVP38/TMEM64 family protein [Myxococcota bacterium]